MTPNRLPHGTVTFLFSDVEGSTRLLRELGPQRYGQVLGTLRELLLAAAREAGGVEVDGQGDGSFMVFRSAGQAATASVAAQRSLPGIQVPVRMRMHTGEAILTSDRYVGFAVHRAARISAAAHGGQIVVFQTVADIVGDALPAGTALRDPGTVSLKDPGGSERLAQLVVEGLPHDFPPLRTHIAKQPTRSEPVLLERDGECAQATALLTEVSAGTGHLVLVEGPSGIGRSTLLTTITHHAHADGAQVLSARASAFEHDFSYGVVRQLFEPMLVRCRNSLGSGFRFGPSCVGSSIGLMGMLVALGVVNLGRMAVITVVVLAQKPQPAKAAIDMPLALAITGLGVVIVVVPSAVPGLMPPM